MKHVIWYKRFIEEPDAVTKIKKEGGREAESRYWDLLDLLYVKWDYVEGSLIRVDRSTIKKELDFMRDISLDKFLIMLRTKGVFKVEFDKDDVLFDSVILWNLMDSDSKYNRSRRVTTSPKRESKSKNKSNIYTPTPFEDSKPEKPKSGLTPDHIVDLWNKHFGIEIGYAVGVGGGVHLKNALEALKWLKTEEAWLRVFDRARASDFLMGRTEGRSWKIDLTWILDYDNVIKVLNGRYDNGASVEHLFSEVGK